MDISRRYISDLQFTLDDLDMEAIEQVIFLLQEARIKNRRVFIMGNGGSASTASHFVCDLAKNTRTPGLPDFKVIGLTDNMAIFSAYANDDGYENVFALQLASLVQPGDIVIGISTSGNSKNVTNAIKLANEAGATTIGFTGFDHGLLGSLVDTNLHVRSNCIEHVEDIHLILEHLICKTLREMGMESSHIEERAWQDPDNGREFDEATGQSFGVSTILPSGNVSASVKEAVTNLNELRRQTGASANRMDLLQQMLRLSLNSVGATSGSIMLFDDRGEISNAVLAYDGEISSDSAHRLVDTLQQGLAGWVVKNRKPALIDSTYEDSRWLRRSWEERNGSRSAVSVPLSSKENVVGVMTLVHPQTEQFKQTDLALLASFGVYISLAALITD